MARDTLDGRVRATWRADYPVPQLSLNAGRYEVYVRGGRTATGLDALEWVVELADLGAGEILLTSMDRDGTRGGYDVALTRAVADAVPVPVIASGGVGTLEHLYEGLTQAGADAVLAASIFHFGQHTIAEAKAYLGARGVPVRGCVCALMSGGWCPSWRKRQIRVGC